MHRYQRKKSLPPIPTDGGAPATWTGGGYASPVRSRGRRASMSDAGARPSTTAGLVNPRRQQIRPQTSTSVVRDPAVQDDDDEEARPARDEVTALREEVRRLQNALLDKFRGTSKFVSGGQFRGHRVERVPVEEKCTVCFSLRTAIKKIRGECRELRDEHEQAQSQLADYMARANRQEVALTAERNKAGEAARELQAELEAARAEAESRRNTISALHTEIDQLRRAQSQTSLDREAIQRSAREVARASMQKEIDALREELEAAKRDGSQAAELQAQLRDACARRDALAKQQEALEAANGELQARTAELEAAARAAAAEAQQRAEHWKAERKHLREEIERARGAAADASEAGKEAARLKLELAREREAGAEARAVLEGELAEARSALAAARARHSRLEKEHDGCAEVQRALDAARAQVASLRGQLDQAGRAAHVARHDAEDVERKLAAAAKEREALQRTVDDVRAQLAATQKRLEGVGEENERQAEEIAHLNALLNDANGSFADQAGELRALRAERDRLREAAEAAEADAERRRREFEARLAEQERGNRSLHDQLREKISEMASLSDKAAKAQVLQSQALESAMQSLVRLCVVAPTVNVHLGDSSMTCKAPLPHDTIRQLVEEQILPRFTSIFLQAEEGSGPNDESLDAWLEGLLAEMQSSIERHLRHVFQERPGSSSASSRPGSRGSSRPTSRSASRRASTGALAFAGGTL